MNDRSVAVAGQIIRWLQDNLQMIDSPVEASKLAESVKDTGGVYFVTAFSGLFAPYWRDDVRGLITGVTMHTRREHICRAALEAVCHRTCEVVDAMQTDSNTKLNTLRVDGGMSQSNIMLKMQRDLLQVPVIRPKMIETTALGAAIAAGLQMGFWKSIEEVKTSIARKDSETVYEATNNDTDSIENAKERREEWRQAVMKTLTRFDNDNDDNDNNGVTIQRYDNSNNENENDTSGNRQNNNKKNGGLKMVLTGVVALGVGIVIGLKLNDILGSNVNGNTNKKS